MKPFRFRAAAALDVRSREERAAEAALARAEAEFTGADRAWAASRERIGTAVGDLERVARDGANVDTLIWHRNWIQRLTAIADARLVQRSRLETAARTARSAWQVAKRRRRVLERLRDRAFRRHQAAEHRHELKVIDELARVRFTTAAAESEGSLR